MLTSKMHALNGLTAVLVSANMAYLACTIKYLYYTYQRVPPQLTPCTSDEVGITRKVPTGYWF